MYLSIMQTVLFKTLLMLVLVNILSICGEMIDQVWEKSYLSMGIFIICDGAMNTYLKEHYLIKKHNGKLISK